jgi:hypothetical protein
MAPGCNHLSMSQYTFFKEVPTNVLQELLLHATDDKHHERVMDNWQPGVGLYGIPSKPYRILSNGKYDVEWPMEESEIRFFKLLSQHKGWEVLNRTDTSLNGGGSPGVIGFRTAEQLRAIWAIIDKTITDYPEYNVDDMLIEESNGDDPADINDYIRYHFGCAVRNSADILITC